jgi:hypothetical protein
LGRLGRVANLFAMPPDLTAIKYQVRGPLACEGARCEEGGRL